MSEQPFDFKSVSSMENLVNGDWHIPFGEELGAQHQLAFKLAHEYNQFPSRERGKEILQELLGTFDGTTYLTPSIFFDYGCNTHFGRKCYANAHLTILDVAEVRFGNNVLIGPNCQFITVGHPVDDVEMRRSGWEIAKPINVGNDCWFGAGVIVLPGVTIGDNCVIGAGTVVTKDIPANSVVVGNPGRVIHTLDESRFERNQLPAGVPLNAAQLWFEQQAAAKAEGEAEAES